MEDVENLWCPEHDSLPNYIKIPNADGTSENVYYSAAYRDVPQEFRVVAEKELNETEENRAKGLRKLRDFIKREKLPDLSDNVLIAILRASKFDRRKSEVRLKKFMRARDSIVAKMEHLDMETAEKIIDDGYFGVLPFRDIHGRIILFTRPAAIDDDAYTKDHVMLTAMASAIALLSYPMTTIVGVAYIGDSKYNSANSYIRIMQSYFQYMWIFLDLPVRLGRVDVTNQHYLLKSFFNIMRPLLSAKIISRVTFHGSDLRDLAKSYHPDILPDEFGGNMGPVDTSYCKKMVLNFLKKLKAESEALRGATREKPK